MAGKAPMPVSRHAELRVCGQRLFKVLVGPVEEADNGADLSDALVDGALVVAGQEALVEGTSSPQPP